MSLKPSSLLAEFRKRQKKIRPAVEHLLLAAEDAADSKGDFASYDEIFGKECNAAMNKPKTGPACSAESSSSEES